MTPLLHLPGLQNGGALGARPEPVREMRLSWPGLDPLTFSLDILMFDDSGSLMGQGGNDPVRNRYSEARRTVRVLSRWTTSPRQKVAVIHFDYPQGGILGPHRLDRTLNRVQVLAALTEPINVPGSSTLAPAMTAATQLARDHGGIVRCTIFSDFELTDKSPMQPFEQIAQFPGSVHAVVLNANPPAALVSLPNVTITRIATDSPPGLAAAALMHSLATGRRGAKRSTIRPTPR